MLSVQPQLAKSLFRFDAASGQLESVMDRAHRPSVFGALDGVPAFERELVERADAIAKSAAASEADAGDVARDLEQLARQAEAADQRSIASAADKAQRALASAESGDQRKEALAQAAKVMNDLVKPHVEAQASKPAPLKPLPPPAVAAPPVPPGQTGLEDDTEMRDIFLEEAREVMQTARDALAQLAKTPNDLNEMTSVRRAFHTLKGSSRMVGLKDFGEAAWGCEQLYNARLADGAGADTDLLELSGEALDYLGRWIEGVAAGATAGFNHRVVGRAADALRNERRRIPLTDDAVSALGGLPAVAPVLPAMPVAPAAQAAPVVVPALPTPPAATAGASRRAARGDDRSRLRCGCPRHRGARGHRHADRGAVAVRSADADLHAGATGRARAGQRPDRPDRARAARGRGRAADGARRVGGTGNAPRWPADDAGRAGAVHRFGDRSARGAARRRTDGRRDAGPGRCRRDLAGACAQQRRCRPGQGDRTAAHPDPAVQHLPQRGRRTFAPPRHRDRRVVARAAPPGRRKHDRPRALAGRQFARRWATPICRTSRVRWSMRWRAPMRVATAWPKRRSCSPLRPKRSVACCTSLPPAS